MRPSSSPRARGQSILVSRPGPVVDELCSRLDNLPLALELAATRVAVLSPEQLLDRLSKRLDLLKAGRGVDPRQQTLRATIEWSYDLLDEEERLLFERLSVFRGGCTLEAAEEVCDADVDTLESLIDKSLLRRQGERFWMLETIREYAVERLERAGRGGRARRPPRRLLPLACRGRRCRRAVRAPGGRVRLHDELDNIRRARGWLIASGDVERERRRLAVAALWALWTRASLRELKAWLVSALDRSADLDAWAPSGCARRRRARGGELGREPRWRGSMPARAWRSPANEATNARSSGRFESSASTSRISMSVGTCWTSARRLLRELGDDGGLGWVAFLLGVTLLDEGRLKEAREALNRAVAIFTGLGRRWEAATAENAIAYVLIADGQHQAARPILEEALRRAVELQSVALAIEALAGLGCVRVQTDPGAAARLFSAAETIAEESGHRLDATYALRFVDRAAETARQRLGDAFGGESKAGTELTLDEAVTLALGEE